MVDNPQLSVSSSLPAEGRTLDCVWVMLFLTVEHTQTHLEGAPPKGGGFSMVPVPLVLCGMHRWY